MDKNRLKNELLNHKSSVNIDEIWSALESDVDAINAEKKRKRRRGFFWLFGVGSVLLLFLLLSYTFYEKQNQYLQTETTMVEKKSFKDKSIETQETSEVAESKNERIEILETLSRARESLDDKKDSATNIEEHIDNMDNNKIVNTGKAREKGSLPYTGRNVKKSRALTGDYNNSIAGDLYLPKMKNTTEKKEKNITTNINEENKVLKEITKVVVTENEFNGVEEPSFTEKSTIVFEEKEAVEASEKAVELETVIASEKINLGDSVLIKETNISEDAVSPEEKNNAVAETIPEPENALVVLEKEGEDNTIKSDTIEAVITEEPLPAAEAIHGNHSKTWQFAVSLDAGLAISNKMLTQKDSLSKELLNLRNETERSLETTHLGLNFGLSHKTGLEFSTGIHYTRIAELFEYNKTRVEYDSIENAIEFYYINLDENKVPVYGVIPNKTTIEEVQKIYNYFHLVDIPVLLAYHYNMESFSIGLETSVFINLALKTKGRILEEDFTKIDLKTNQERVYQSSAGMSFQVGLPFRYHLNDKMDLSFKPYWRKFLKNFAVDNYGLEQKYSLLGLDAGLRWWF